MSAALLAAVLVLVGATTAWAAFVTEGTYTVGDNPYALTVGDFNGDQRTDVATINGESNNVSVFLRQVGGGFAQEAGSPIAVTPGPSNAVAADFNGDGKTDLAVGEFSSAGVSVLLRKPTNDGFALENGQQLSLGGQVSAVASGDFNGDGRPDLAALLRGNSQVVILLRQPAGGFAQGNAYPTGLSPEGLTVGNFNGDTSPDLAITNRNDGTITILVGTGTGTFTAEPAVAAGNQPIGIATADFNLDGRGDLAVANYGTGTLSVFLRRASNDGFDAEPPMTVSATPASVAAADFDRDGRPDLAIASNAGGIDVLHRNAGGGFTLDPFITLANAVNSVAAPDFDGDSRPDIAVSAYSNPATTDTFTVLLNPAPAGPAPTPTPTATPTPLPTPVAGKTVNAVPKSGKVTIKRPGSKKFVTLTAGAQIPVGTTIDTRKGRIEITAAQGKGKTASALFYDGLFKLTQTKGSKPVTTLALTEKLTCPKAKHASAAAKKKKSRKLWGDGGGSFRTRGQYSAATVRGTKWLVQDTCTSTTTRVSRGAVTVNDLVKHKTVVVRAEKRYTARAKRR